MNRLSNQPLEPTAAAPSGRGGAERFAAPVLRRGPVSGGCGSARRWAAGMTRVTATALLCLGLASSGRANRPLPQHVEAPVFIPTFVGHYVWLEGVVSNTPVPQTWGVDLWGLEKLAGQRVRVTGTVQCTVVARTGPDTGRVLDSGDDGFASMVMRHPGTYYRLQGMQYEVLR